MKRVLGGLLVLTMISTALLFPRKLYTFSIQLSDPSHFVAEFNVSPDGRYVLYGSGNDLISVPASGGTPQRLGIRNDVSILGPYQVSSDSKYIVYAGTLLLTFR